MSPGKIISGRVKRRWWALHLVEAVAYALTAIRLPRWPLFPESARR